MPTYTVTVRGVTWKRTTPTKRVKIAWDDHEDPGTKRYYAREHVTEYKDESFLGNVEVTIDIEEIVRIMAARAAHNNSGATGTMRGLIKARVKQKQLQTTTTRPHPIPKGYSELAPEPEPKPEPVPAPGTVGGGPHPSEAVPYPVVNGVMYPNGKRGTE